MQHPRTPRRSTALLALSLLAGSAIPPLRAQDLKRQLMPLITAHEGVVAVAIKNLSTGVTFRHEADKPMPTASLIKFPVMIEAYRQAAAGTIDLDAKVTLREEDKVPGSGILTGSFSAGAEFSLRDAIRLMIAFSDNTATNLVIDRIGLPSTAKTMAGLGCPQTRLHAKVFRRDTSIAPERSERFGLGSTTAGEMISLLERLHGEKLVSETASREMLAHLLACRDRDKLPRFLPPGTKVAHKTGSVSAARCAAGILYLPGAPVAVCVLTADNKDQRWDRDNAGDLLCARVAQVVYRHFAGVQAGKPGPLTEGANGPLVEDLQRTLNARLAPSPGLGVDGDFGPATLAAVQRFQQTKGLKVTGVVDAATFDALGVLVTTDEAVPPPDQVNAAVLPTLPPDPVDGPPFVTCKAWAIADGETGGFLWGHEEQARLDIASTTKIMTGYLVFRFAAKDPAVLDEVVTFSPRADATGGSTAGVRAGERLPVRELLYGLLLPSGNDASVALAEHFGGRCGAADGSDDPLDRFVAEMNRTAKALGMERTSYRNPHGLTAPGHQSCAKDLLRLAHAALADERFRRYVGTRQRGCRLEGSDGHRRDVIWRNTNQLLATEGYLGVKTGTTRNAGACLVSCAERDGRRLILVVLGSAASAARYTDSRNLFRWGFAQRRGR